MANPEDRAGDEVGGEDRRVPSGEQRDGEVHRDDRMDREDERRREGGEDEVGALVVLPLPHGAAPAEGEETVDELPGRGLRPVAESSPDQGSGPRTRRGPRPFRKC